MAHVYPQPQQQPEGAMSTSISDTPPPQPRPDPAPHPGQNISPLPLPLSPPTDSPSSSSSQPSHAAPSTTSHSRRRHSLPLFSFPVLSQPNTSSTSLVPSTAEGRPIPLDDASAADRTSALRELNRSQPSSRHRYTKSSGAPSTTTRTTTGTYSQPVIVRTYSGPPPSSSTNRRPVSRRIPLSSVSVTTNVSNWRPGRHGMILSMARHKGSNKGQRGDDAKLPPLEAFSFKSIMADIQQDIGADLDRIAEICARSKYSLSNQYEVHITPHSSGTGFLASASSSSSRHQAAGGPTLQAISSDDEQNSTRHRKRRSGARRRSAAYGTLETIMSSSRSSEEDKSKKKSAQELADEVRGRASRHHNGGSGSSRSSAGDTQSNENSTRSVARKKSTSFATAMLDSTRHQGPTGDVMSPRASGTALVSEPAKPKTSGSHLEIRTTQDDVAASRVYAHHEPPGEPSHPVISGSMAAAAISSPEEPRPPSSLGLLSGFGSWIPWRGGGGGGGGSGSVSDRVVVTEVAAADTKGGTKRNPKSYAEGSLRDLLKSTDGSPADLKTKTVER
ncbi:hypothetical protein BX600DRAFT_472305 [Xylariales sp. PMI_506]|nr:hypothetical protein BX600DRAFT_472305 [Xylariales sp. PMI_506]